MSNQNNTASDPTSSRGSNFYLMGPNMQMLRLKEEISRITGAPIGDLILKLNGRVLGDEETPASLNFSGEEKVFVYFKREE